MTTVLDVIAPPIAEHEVVEVWLAHDMVGYVGVEALVYRAFSKVMEQTEGGDVIVHQGAGNQTEDVEPENRQLNACEGYEQAVKLAKVKKEKQSKAFWLCLFILEKSPILTPLSRQLINMNLGQH